MSIATGWKLDIVLTFSKQKSNQNVVTFSTRGVEPFSTSFRLLLFRISAVNCRPENSPKKKMAVDCKRPQRIRRPRRRASITCQSLVNKK